MRRARPPPHRSALARALLGTETMTAQATDPATDDLRTLLGREHTYLNALFENIVDAFDTNNSSWCAECFGELEQRLEGHMRLEEEQIFPGLQRVDPVEADALREQHARIRTQLASLAVGVDLHTAQATAIHDLVRVLREHASREDALAYRWADANLDAPSHAKLQTRVRERISSLVERARSRWGIQKIV